MEIDIEIAKIYTYKREFDKNKHRLQDTVRKNLPLAISRLKNEITTGVADKEIIAKQQNKPFEIEIAGKKYYEAKGANEKIHGLISEHSRTNEKFKIGKYKEMDIYYQHINKIFENDRVLYAKGNGEYKVETKLDTYGHVRRLDNIIGLEVLDEKISKASDSLIRHEEELLLSKEELEKPFSYKDVLVNLTKRQTQLNSLLNFDKTDDIVMDSNDFITITTEEEITIEAELSM